MFGQTLSYKIGQRRYQMYLIFKQNNMGQTKVIKHTELYSSWTEHMSIQQITLAIKLCSQCHKNFLRIDTFSVSFLLESFDTLLWTAPLVINRLNLPNPEFTKRNKFPISHRTERKTRDQWIPHRCWELSWYRQILFWSSSLNLQIWKDSAHFYISINEIQIEININAKYYSWFTKRMWCRRVADET